MCKLCNAVDIVKCYKCNYFEDIRESYHCNICSQRYCKCTDFYFIKDIKYCENCYKYITQLNDQERNVELKVELMKLKNSYDTSISILNNKYIKLQNIISE